MTSTTIANDLLREAAEWRLIGLLFEPPGEAWRCDVAALAAEVADETLREAATLAPQQATEGLYHSTFGPGGPAAPREVSYRRGVLPGAMISEIESAYAAFGFDPAVAEPPDHVAVLAGFVGYLRLKEAFARSQGEDREAAVAAEAAAWIVAEHLALLAEPLERALRQSGLGYLALAAAALLRRAMAP